MIKKKIKLQTNSFDINDDNVLYYIISRINHNIKPNAMLIYPDKSNDFIILYCLKDINVGDEITISYYLSFFALDDVIKHHNIIHEIPETQLELPGYTKMLQDHEYFLLLKNYEVWQNNDTKLKDILSKIKSSGIKSRLLNNITLSLAFQLENKIIKKLLFEFLYENIHTDIEETSISWYYNFVSFHAVSLIGKDRVDECIKLIKTMGEMSYNLNKFLII